MSVILKDSQFQKIFEKYMDIKAREQHDIVMQLLHSIGAKQAEDIIDDNDIANIISIIDNYVMDEITVETCVPYRDDNGTPCYKLNTCGSKSKCVFSMLEKNPDFASGSKINDADASNNIHI